jgi:hypothetical protein
MSFINEASIHINRRYTSFSCAARTVDSLEPKAVLQSQLLIVTLLPNVDCDGNYLGVSEEKFMPYIILTVKDLRFLIQ